MRLGGLFGRERAVEALKRLRALRFTVSHSSLLHVSLLLIILAIAFMVRMLPLRWGPYLSEFDPYVQYRMADYMVNRGFFAWTSWHDYTSWYPAGRDMARSAFPGVAFSSTFFYVILRSLGVEVTLLQCCVIFPAVMGTLSCLAIYYLCKDIGGREAGIFASLFLALNGSYISRTSLGFFDDETVGIFGLLLFFLFFLRSIEGERPLGNSLAYALAAGLSLGYLGSSWGASRYPVGITSLSVLVLILMRRYSPRLLFSYSVAFGLAFFIPVNAPLLGFGFLTETSNLSVAGVFLLLCLCELFRYVQSAKSKIVLAAAFLALIPVLFLGLQRVGFISPMGLKFVRVINPFSPYITPLHQSVAEHRPAAWGSFYYENGIGALFIPVGLFFTVRNPTSRNVFLSIYVLTSLYFASSMIRLTLILAPAFCALLAVTLVRLVKPFVTLMREAPVVPTRRKRLMTHVGRGFSAVFLIAIVGMLMVTYVIPDRGRTASRPIEHAYSPTTIAASSCPVAADIPDWINALTWMRDNAADVNGDGRVVMASWWDYGYWITVLANKTSLADNGTINMTQIEQIAKMFMSNETEAIKILRGFDADYVVVFTTCAPSTSDGNWVLMDRGWGDEGKWRWMARIGGVNESDYGDVDYVVLENSALGTGNMSYWRWSDDVGKNCVIYKLMTYGRETRAMDDVAYGISIETTVELDHFRLRYYTKGNYGWLYVLVLVYEVGY